MLSAQVVARCFSLALFGVLSFFSAHAADPLVARISGKMDARVYDQSPMTLDGSGSTQGEGITYLWTVTGGETGTPIIEDSDKITAHFTPAIWGRFDIGLKVTRGADHAETRQVIYVLNDPAKDDSPVFDGATKVLYKEAPDALGGSAKLYLHIFNPPGWQTSDKRTAVILFHGGGWGHGSPVRYVPDAQYWASRGVVGITAQYRLGQREGTQPQDCVADAKSAVRYVRAHAAELGIDPQKIAVGGESAGAHIAACTGTVPAYNDPKDDLSVSCVPNALLLYFPYQMVCDRGNRKDDMSPLHFVTATTPPTLFIAGEEDRIAPAENGITWGDQMKAGSNLFRFFIYRKAHHPSDKHDMIKPGVDNDMIRQTDLFLAELGFVTGPPTIPSMDATAIAQLHVDPKTFQPPAPKPAPAPSNKN